jgi:AmpE protein
MTLFSILVLFGVYKLGFFQERWSAHHLFDAFRESFFDDKKLNNPFFFWLALIFPAAFIFLVCFVVKGMVIGLLSLLLWIVIAYFCFNQQIRYEHVVHAVEAFKTNDSKASMEHLGGLEATISIDNLDKKELAPAAGQLIVWTQYRRWIAVLIYFMLLGPAMAVLYCSALYYEDFFQGKSKQPKLFKKFVFILDWVPARAVAFSYLLTGNFPRGFLAWTKKALLPHLGAYDILTNVATKSIYSDEQLHSEEAPVVVSSYFQLAQRTFILWLVILALLTIFGVIF